MNTVISSLHGHIDGRNGEDLILSTIRLFSLQALKIRT